jgi:hypothetical protein
VYDYFMLSGPALKAQIDEQHWLCIVRDAEMQWNAFAAAPGTRLPARPYSSASEDEAKEHAYEVLKQHINATNDATPLPTFAALSWEDCLVPLWTVQHLHDISRKHDGLVP